MFAFYLVHAWNASRAQDVQGRANSRQVKRVLKTFAYILEYYDVGVLLNTAIKRALVLDEIASSLAVFGSNGALDNEASKASTCRRRADAWSCRNALTMSSFCARQKLHNRRRMMIVMMMVCMNQPARAVNQDSTRFKGSESALQKSELQLREALDALRIQKSFLFPAIVIVKIMHKIGNYTSGSNTVSHLECIPSPIAVFHNVLE